jgi:hypothetical protein
MNRYAAHLAEKTIELSFSLQNMATPNPFQPLAQKEPWWRSVDLDDFYATPAAPPQLTFHSVWKGLKRTRARFTFPSSDLSPFAENNLVRGLANLAPDRSSRAALIVIHGHRMTNFSALEWFAIPASQLGLDIYYITLPYHMERAPKGTWSGQLTLNSDVEGTALAFRQGVLDVRSLISWIAAERGTPVGLAGMSLGAFTACMTSVVDPRPLGVVSILGGASLAQLQWDGYQMGRPKSQLIEGGVTRARLEKYWEILGPGYWKPSIPKQRILMMAGKYDPIVTPANVEHLWRAWDKPSIHWYACGHGTIAVYYLDAVKEILSFLEKNLLDGQG